MFAISGVNYDHVIVGSGIVGMSVALELKKRFPSANIAILDKEKTLGVHASGRNSGVLHSGIYYPKESLKAAVCKQGAARLIDFAKEHHIAYSQQGKVIVASDQSQLETMERLLENAKINGIRAYRLNGQELLELEPAANPDFGAIYCPDTAVIDAPAVLKELYKILKEQGVTFYFECEVIGVPSKQQLKTTKGIFSFGTAFNCAGAHADTIAQYFDLPTNYTLIPFKGIYWKLSAKSNPLVRSNIYPFPDISMPFLGVHLTRGISGEVYVGPTAIPVLGRENYSKLQDIHFKELATIGYELVSLYFKNHNHFRKLAKAELSKYNKRVFFASAKKLVPQLKIEDLEPSTKAGIRPQLINKKTKKLEMDYIIERGEHSIHVLNAISPAFTSSFAFAEMIVEKAFSKDTTNETCALH